MHFILIVFNNSISCFIDVHTFFYFALIAPIDSCLLSDRFISQRQSNKRRNVKNEMRNVHTQIGECNATAQSD